MRRPSKLLYQIVSGSVRLSLVNNSAFTWVTGSILPEALFTRNTSPMFVGVESSTAIFEPSGVALYEITA